MRDMKRCNVVCDISVGVVCDVSVVCKELSVELN